MDKRSFNTLAMLTEFNSYSKDDSKKYKPKNDRYYEELRARSVGIALELISDDIYNTNNTELFEYHLANLSKYASQIEDALDREKDNS